MGMEKGKSGQVAKRLQPAAESLQPGCKLMDWAFVRETAKACLGCLQAVCKQTANFKTQVATKLQPVCRIIDPPNLGGLDFQPGLNVRVMQKEQSTSLAKVLRMAFLWWTKNHC